MVDKLCLLWNLECLELTPIVCIPEKAVNFGGSSARLNSMIQSRLFISLCLYFATRSVWRKRNSAKNVWMYDGRSRYLKLIFKFENGTDRVMSVYIISCLVIQAFAPDILKLIFKFEKRDRSSNVCIYN